ncbi:hypothetical protein JOD16_000781 [Enterococcus xiangfangensis]|nr:hypothetical protein [Enterococcus xiangfangensis]MBM7711217.1 hypothetical protein [Enterococcus xiangfangensis]
MKYNKIISLLAIGTMVGPTLLASQQVFAEENSTIASDSATASSETQTPESSSTESSVPQVPSEPSTEPEQPEKPEQVHYRLLANGEQLPNNTLTDANGNQIVFQYDSATGLVKGATVHYTVTLAAGFELKEVKILNSLMLVF